MPQLRVVDGKLLGETFDLDDGEVTVGRAGDNDIVLPDERVSRRHCRMEAAGDSVLIEDLGSSNGTYVNGRAVERARLFEGDEVRLGGHVLEVHVVSRAAAADDVVIMPDTPGLKSTTVEIIVPDDTSDFVSEHIARAESPERLLRDLGLVYQVGNLINGVRDHERLLKTVLDMAFEAVNAAHGFLVILDENGKPSVKARRCQSGRGERGLTVSDAVAEIVLKRGQGVLINDALHDERFSSSDSIIRHHLRSVLCVPLKCKQKVLGFIYLDNPSIICAFCADDLRLVSAIAIQAAVAIENSRLFRALEDLMFGAIGALVATVEAKDPYLKGHSERVARISRALGEELRLGGDVMKVLHLSALLHDIGKIGISESILHKEGGLTEEEKQAVMEHAPRGAEILGNIKDMSEIAMAVRHHHECYDGRGYPDGIAGDDVPLPSRILAVADSYDAMTSNRPYRGKLAQAECLAEIVRCSGSQFDPDAVEALLKCARKHRISRLSMAS